MCNGSGSCCQLFPPYLDPWVHSLVNCFVFSSDQPLLGKFSLALWVSRKLFLMVLIAGGSPGTDTAHLGQGAGGGQEPSLSLTGFFTMICCPCHVVSNSSQAILFTVWIFSHEFLKGLSGGENTSHHNKQPKPSSLKNKALTWPYNGPLCQATSV